MKAYQTYLNDLQNLTNQNELVSEEELVFALDGQAYKELRSSISVDDRRASGAFFTSTNVSQKLAAQLFRGECEETSFMDPACGSGQLLLAAARHLPLKNSLSKTLSYWEELIFGFDIHKEFVCATRLRLALLAKSRGRYRENICDVDRLFRNIRVGSYFDNSSVSAKFILLNPPFNAVVASNNCEWGKGKVSSAALFLDTLVSRAEVGTEISAVLPEVLRCGTRYNKFRSYLGRKCLTQECASIGVFDAWTDVDVFIAKLIVADNVSENRSAFRLFEEEVWNHSVEDHFVVRVGAVVPYRDPQIGIRYPYIQAKNLPVWDEAFQPYEKRRFSGTVFKPPFVAIRRTSRPGDKYRAIGTIVVSDKEVAVENHLIVVQPKSGSHEDCRRLLGVLKEKTTNQRLDEIMRCRHLTVKSIKEIPWTSTE